MMRLAVGQPYPGHCPDEGIHLDAFAPGATLLRVGMPSITRPEALAYRKGRVRFGLALAPGAILTLWKFGDQPWTDAPFNAPLSREHGYLELPDIGPASRLVVELHLVDTATNLVRGIRQFTLTAAQTTALASAVQDQLASGASDAALRQLIAQPTERLARHGEIK